MGRLGEVDEMERALVEPPEAAREGSEAVQGERAAAATEAVKHGFYEDLQKRAKAEAPGTPVDRLGSMSPRARWALKCAGITTLEGAAARTDEELLAIPHFGESSLVRLRAWQANPADLPPPAGRFLSETREDRIYAVYAALRGAGHTKLSARELAVAEVDELAAHLRGEKSAQGWRP